MNMTHGSILPRSATAPVAMVTVIAENIPWYTAKRRSGILSEATEGCARTSLKPKLVRSPMNGVAEREKVNE